MPPPEILDRDYNILIKTYLFLSLLSFKMRKGFFPRKMSKVISTVIPRSTLDEAFVLPENEVCASCRHFQY